MRDIRHEVTLPLGSRVEPAEHRVHRGGQPPDFVIGPVTGDPGVQVLFGDLV